MIGFPLSDRDAKLIERVATQAPFGKGTKTVVDTTVRDTFEINPDKFSFKNPAWDRLSARGHQDGGCWTGFTSQPTPPSGRVV
jgi:hypothetical protein